MQQAWRRHQKDVVCKIAARPTGRAEMLQSPRSAPKLSCCLQDPLRQLRPAKPVRRYVLGPELRCCLQAGTAAVSGRGPSAAPGSVAWRRGAPPGIASSSRDGRRATCANCPDKPGGIPDRRRSFLCGTPCAADAGNRPRYKPFAAAETWTVGSSSDNSGNAVLPSCGCRTGLPQRERSRFRNCCRVPTASPPMAWPGYIAGESAVVLDRGQHVRLPGNQAVWLGTSLPLTNRPSASPGSRSRK
jgi:hypothetical protein